MCIRDSRVFDRSLPGQPPVTAGDADVVAIRMIEPMDRNGVALGVNALSIPAAREAILRAVDTDAPAASTGFVLTQEPGQQTGVVLYRALYRGEPAATDRRQALKGVVFVTLRMQQSAEAGLRDAPAYLRWCLVDSQPQAQLPRLAGPVGCEQAQALPLRHLSLIHISEPTRPY